jgi:sRNA-binding regulator protein Hfq
MNNPMDQPERNSGNTAPVTRIGQRLQRKSPAALSVPLQARAEREHCLNRQTEVSFLQKQIQAQTPMVIVLEDGERIEGCIEWQDSLTLKVRGRNRVLVYKSAIKYMHKRGETEP